jgi:hypothetical protein
MMERKYLNIRPPEEWVVNWRNHLVRLAELEAATIAAQHSASNSSATPAAAIIAATRYAGEAEKQRHAMGDLVADYVGGAYAAVCLENPLAQPTPDGIDVQDRGRSIMVAYTVRDLHE